MTVAPTKPKLSPVERIYRKNFFLFTIDGIFFVVALSMIGSTTVVPDFVRKLTNSEILIGLSGSLFDIGYTLPQLFIARYIVQFERKKWWFAGPNIPVRFVIFIFGMFVLLAGKNRPELILPLFLLCYGIAAFGDGLVGVPWADLAGNSLDNRWRARMLGIMSAIANLTMLLLVSPFIAVILSASGPGFPENYGLVFALSGLMFALSILPPLFFHELPGGKAVEKIPAMREYLPELGRVLYHDAPFRAMMATRILTTLFAMSGAFYIGFATTQLGLSSAVAVPTLLTMQTIGSIIGALIYAWLGARNNMLFIRMALLTATMLPVAALLAPTIGAAALFPGFLLSGMALSNLGLGYQNWVISHAPADRRPMYIGLFNTLNALVLMISPFIAGTIVQTISYQAVFTVSLVMGISALFVTLRYLSNTPPAKIPDLAAAD